MKQSPYVSCETIVKDLIIKLYILTLCYPIISQKEVRLFYVIIFLCSDKLYNISAKVSFF